MVRGPIDFGPCGGTGSGCAGNSAPQRMSKKTSVFNAKVG
jgi:hypothetical protein